MTKNIVEFPDRKAVEEEAAAWLIKLDGDSPLAAEELAALREWLGRSPAHREQLRGFADFWGKLNVLTELAVPLGHAKGRTNRGLVGLRHAFPQFGRAVVMTAALVVGIGIAATFWLRPDSFVNSNGLYATAIGQQQSTTFPDGSVVLLNTNSQIKVDYNDAYRDIRLLQGEAHFTVAPNAARPFRVYAGHGRVEAVGTAFSVYLKGNTVDVTVTEGKVALASVNVPSRQSTQRLAQQEAPSGSDQSSGSVAILDSGLVETLGTLQAGESATIQGVFDADIASTIEVIEMVEEQEMAKRQSWRDGVLTFAGDPLEVVVHEISRYTTISIEFSDPAVKATRIGGRFPIGETDAMFDALEANFGLRVTRLGRDRVLVSVADE
jgi:transmembrane sensor